MIISNHLWYKRLTARSVRAEKCTAIINYPDLGIVSPHISRVLSVEISVDDDSRLRRDAQSGPALAPHNLDTRRRFHRRGLPQPVKRELRFPSPSVPTSGYRLAHFASVFALTLKLYASEQPSLFGSAVELTMGS